MPRLEQHESVNSNYAPPPIDLVHAAWGPEARSIQKQTSNAMEQLGEFSIGFGEGLNHFANETSQSIKQAISNPSKTIHDLSIAGSDAIKTTSVACVAGAAYLNNHIANNDFGGVAKDAKSTYRVVIDLTAHSVDHFNHLSAREKGYVVGHDVAPAAAGTVLMPEILPEGALAAGFGKVATTTGALIKDEQICVKAASTFNGAIDRINSISEKLAEMTAKLDELRLSAELERRISHVEKIHHLAGARGSWEKIGEQACEKAVQQLHPNACVAAVGHMLTDGAITQEQLIEKLGGIWGAQMLEHMAQAGKFPPYSIERLQKEIDWTAHRWGDENLKVELENALKGHLPFGAEMHSTAGAHAIVVDGLNKATTNLVIRDPANATSYEMKVEEFIEFWGAIIAKK